MKNFFRIVASFISGVAALYFVSLSLSGLVGWATPLISVVFSVVVARYVWLHTASPQPGLVGAGVLGALLLGGIGFSAGFFGPLIFMPDANQGPLLGIFITGPLGFLLGAVGGVVYWFARGSRAG